MRGGLIAVVRWEACAAALVGTSGLGARPAGPAAAWSPPCARGPRCPRPWPSTQLVLPGPARRTGRPALVRWLRPHRPRHQTWWAWSRAVCGSSRAWRQRRARSRQLPLQRRERSRCLVAAQRGQHARYERRHNTEYEPNEHSRLEVILCVWNELMLSEAPHSSPPMLAHSMMRSRCRCWWPCTCTRVPSARHCSLNSRSE